MQLSIDIPSPSLSGKSLVLTLAVWDPVSPWLVLWIGPPTYLLEVGILRCSLCLWVRDYNDNES